ncbi:uncharacterized protein [Spinacia oleracea]|uniref:Reverse transcriptase zinc-binding domain-containing protein n=1 Tax=Spinacia oleracea TaxID=3562 RepID=A0ABM3QQI3_SPIOL|nr:uncharacterized protein LOC130461514 [Spinacia oleracea]
MEFEVPNKRRNDMEGRDGVNINIWNDLWVADEEGRFILSDMVDELNHVGDLVDPMSKEWNVDLIEEKFNERDVRCILAIPLSCREQCDEITWAYSNDGEYSVKTSYMLGKGCNFDTFHQAFIEIWSMEVSPKVRHFLWRLCTETLPVKDLLKKRHLRDEAVCPWCQEVETTGHAIFGCVRVKELWEAVECMSMINWEEAGTMCDLVDKWKVIDAKTKQRGDFLAWCIWGERNMKVFENKLTPNVVLIERVSRHVDDYGKYAARIYNVVMPRTQPSPKTWKAPPDGVLKINADASLVQEGRVGLGVVARDSGGHVVFAATKRVKAI